MMRLQSWSGVDKSLAASTFLGIKTCCVKSKFENELLSSRPLLYFVYGIWPWISICFVEVLPSVRYWCLLLFGAQKLVEVTENQPRT